jgi:glycosyltransferase involved in cell wall biosynthesis
MELLSIVIPTYNRSEQLADCINSILSQDSVPPPPIIVIDDGSIEEHARANSEYCKKNNLIYIFLPQSAGLAAAENRGIERSHSHWVVFLNDNFIVGKSWLERMSALLSTAPSSLAGVKVRVTSSGYNLRDSEAMNLSAETFLSCHIAYRRDLLLIEKGFDNWIKDPFCKYH